MDAFSQIFDVTLLATVGLIFAVTLVGAYLRAQKRDECLKSFEGYQVTIERTDDKLIWGEMALESTGMELHYRDTVQDANHIVSSYVIYGPEYGDIQAIYRYVDQLDEAGLKKRQRELDRSFHPGPFLRLARAIQHFFYLANESVSDVMSIIIGRLRKPAGRYITDSSEEHLRRLGDTVIGSVGGNYDPIMENLIGHKVVADVLEGDEVHEHVGNFKNYSPDFVELLNVQFPERKSVELAPERDVDAFVLSAVVDGSTVRVKNLTTQPILLQSLTIDNEDEEEMLNVVVNSNESVELHPQRPFTHASLNVRVVRELDMIVPRTRCVIRHRAERYKPEILPEIIFDLGIILTGNSLIDAREARLRKRIEENPYAALAMSNLGGILVQKQKYQEAARWLRKAYELRNSLPDNGKRTLMLLHELERKSDRVRTGENGYDSTNGAYPV